LELVSLIIPEGVGNSELNPRFPKNGKGELFGGRLLLPALYLPNKLVFDDPLNNYDSPEGPLNNPCWSSSPYTLGGNLDKVRLLRTEESKPEAELLKLILPLAICGRDGDEAAEEGSKAFPGFTKE